MDLKNKTVLITGAARRIGRAIALAFAEKQSKVLIHYNRSHDEAAELVEQLRLHGCDAIAYQADLSDQSALLQMIEQIVSDHGMVDVLVNNASKFYPTPLTEIDDWAWDDLLSIHVKVPFILSQRLGLLMKDKGEGRIINMADWRGLRPRKNFAAYCTSKAALLALTQSLAKDLAPEVLVTAVCPGPILPVEGAGDDEKERIAKKTLLKKWGSPEDVARQVMFLAEQDYATGSSYLVDGGESLL